MSGMERILDEMMFRFPMILGIIFLDEDGFPIATAGDYSLDVDGLGPTIAYCYKFHAQMGMEMRMSLESVVVDFDKMRFCQCSLPNGTLTVLAEAGVKLGMIRFITRKIKNKLESFMKEREAERKIVPEEPRLKLPSEEEIRSIIARLESESLHGLR
ncbi:MAG: hypothetical protein JXB26_08915 [Candidatus Aminicenantes bacterium]|nr:hypothetical protein [Candidatus Aminicenantes bacterium]